MVSQNYDFIKCSVKFNKKVLLSFLESFISKSTKKLNYNYGKTFFIEFENSLSDPKQPLSFETYMHQIKYFQNYYTYKSIESNRSTFTALQLFYTFYQIHYDNDVFNKSGYSTSLLVYPRTISCILKGFIIVNHNKMDKVPESDRWLFCFKDNDNSTQITIKQVDYSFIDNPFFRNLYKRYIWSLNSKISVELNNSSRIKLFFNYIYALETGKIYSFYVRDMKNSNSISTQQIKAFKYYILTHYKNKANQYCIFGTVRRFLKFLLNNNLLKLDSGVFFELSNIGRGNLSSSSKPIATNELKLLGNKMIEKAKSDSIYYLYHLLFYLALETEFRFSQICELQVNCVKTTAKNNQYVLISQTKTSHQEIIEQPISIYTKKCIDEAIKLTTQYRLENTNKELDNLLFIVPGVRKNTFTYLNNNKFNSVLKKLCSELQINPVMVSNLRDTHMTLAESFIIKEQLSDIQLKVLTSHSSSFITDKYYSRLDIIEMLEASNKVIIGDVGINGQIVKNLPPNINKKENLVSDGCGYCSSPHCYINSDLSCLLCKNFVTTTSRRIYFEEQLKIIDSLITSKDLPHDKEDLINRKRLFLKYIDALINLEVEDIND